MNAKGCVGYDEMSEKTGCGVGNYEAFDKGELLGQDW